MKTLNYAAWLLAFVTSLTVVSCNGKQKAAADAANQFFSAYQKNFRTADPRYLSTALAAEIQKATAGEKASAARMKAGPTPTDKPNLLEGELFCSLYEGYTSFKTGDVRMKDGKAYVTVEFEHSTYKEKWKDELVMVDENGWKVDDLLYTGHKKASSGIREELQKFNALVAAEKP